MPDYRRVRTAGATYFFTVNLLDRRSTLLLQHIASLREAVRKAKAARPFHIDAWVVLPEHMHCMRTLPEGDSDYSSRWRDIKIRFARSLPKTEAIRFKPRKRGERGIWQRRFWEYTIRNEDDYQTHFDLSTSIQGNSNLYCMSKIGPILPSTNMFRVAYIRSTG